MNKTLFATTLCRVATEAIELKAAVNAKTRRRRERRELFVRQATTFQREMVKGLVPFFRDMIEEVAVGFERMGGGPGGDKAFCPTGEGGGIDNSCSPNRGGGKNNYDIQVNENELLDAISNLFPSPYKNTVDKNTIAEMSGAPSGAKVTIETYPEVIKVTWKTENAIAARRIYRDGDRLVCHNFLCSLDKEIQGSGVGTTILQQQVKSLAAHGVSEILAEAARGQSSNGYYTWPRLGYDAAIPSEIEVPSQFKSQKLSDLMKTPGGRSWWKENGVSFDATFDLKEGSLSRKVLDAYVAEKRSRAAAGTKSGGRGHSGQGVGRTKSHTDSASNLVSQVFSPRKWKQRLIDVTLPILARGMGAAAMAEVLMVGAESAVKVGAKAFCPTGEGGGIDNSCSPSRGGGFEDAWGSLEDVRQAGYVWKKMPFLVADEDDDEIQEMVSMTESRHILKAPIVEIALDRLIATQERLEEPTVEHFFGQSPSDKDLPVIIRSGSSYYIYDGHHRLVAEKLKGNTTARVRLAMRGAEDIIPWVGKIPSDLSKSKSFTKATTASQWLQTVGINAPPGVKTEWPAWLIKKIEEQLAEAYDQPYWAEIVDETTRDDIEDVVARGLRDGHSIRDIADDIRTELDGDYYKNRSFIIARTECGAALSGGRKAAIEALQDELGPQVELKAVWRSLLLETTRDAHANLDGVPADENGEWDLNGVLVPYPGHYSLPASDRVSCYCYIDSEFGYSDADAAEAIQAYQERVARHAAGEGEFADDYDGDFSDAKSMNQENPYNALRPVCKNPAMGSCRCMGPHTQEDLAKGHGYRCVNGHRWSGDLVLGQESNENQTQT